ncbi:MAG: hypothetical protein M1835_006991 [Candelina submexicana]|nr:MAG: hypothetical protein M1835_006991 [Candelina submexicana]
MKQRFSSLDVKVIAHELSNSLCSLRLANAYDLSSRIFLLKFAKPDNRQQLVIDSGFRCHLTSFARATAVAPSAFVARLRKYLRTRRVTSVSQIGTDRIIELQFSDGQYRLFLEFYAGGNIVLTDKELNNLALLRIVAEGQDQEELRVGLKYSLSNRQNYEGVPPLTRERVKNGLQRALDKQHAAEPAFGKKSKKSTGDALRKALATSITEYPPMLVEHSLRATQFDSSLKPDEVVQDDSLLDKLMLVFEEAKRVVEAITSSETAKGYIIAKPNKPAKVQEGETSAESQKLLYDDFHPFRPRQFEDEPSATLLEFDGFNKTVDEFFSSIEAQKLESRLQDREDNAKRKLESARLDHEKRLGGLQQVQELNVRKAQAIEANLQRVEEATAAVNGLIGQGMDWVEIARLIEMEQARQNPVADLIKLPLKLYENTATLLLGEMEFEDEGYDGDETDSDVSDSDGEDQKPKATTAKPVDKRLAVDVDLALSPWSNARQYYDQKKTAAVKEQKTLQSSSKALKSTEKKITADLKKGLKQEKQVLRPVRKQLWFEKFMYFISSDGYLVLGGRDAQQNEILYKRYLKKGDIYVHADLHGASSVIIKNNPSTPDAPISPSTLSQAGNLSIATSSAWDSKAVMSAWWVNSDQVSKTAPTGEYLTTGGFMIRGKKNFLPPAQLLLGFGVMFQISEESKARHVKHRLRDETEAVTQMPTDNVEQDGTIPDAPESQADREPSEDDSDDEEFPDARLESMSDDDDDKSESVSSDRINPLQTNGTQQQSSQDTDDKDHQRGENEQNSDENEGEDEALDDNQNESSQPTPTESEQKAGVRHLSAKERRLLRKGQNQSSTSQTPSLTNTDNEESDHAASITATPSAKGPSQGPQPRGKRTKQKKLAAKYALQEPSERALALRLLGSQAAREKAKSDTAAKEAKDAELAFQKQRRREQHQRAVKEGKEAEEVRRLMHEEGVELLDEDEVHSMSVLEGFVGTPLPGDEILEAIPVCAPWVSLGKYKYKAKLQPGSTKKGKAVKEILGRWNAEGNDRKKVDTESQDTERMWPREVELIKQWKDTEIINTVPVGKVRVLMAGGSAGKGSAGGAQGKGRGGKGSKKR